MKDPTKVGIENAKLVHQYKEEHGVGTQKACDALSVKISNYYRYARLAGIEVGPPVRHKKAKQVNKSAKVKAAVAAKPAPAVAATGRVAQKAGQIMLLVGSPGDIAAIVGKII